MLGLFPIQWSKSADKPTGGPKRAVVCCIYISYDDLYNQAKSGWKAADQGKLFRQDQQYWATSHVPKIHWHEGCIGFDDVLYAYVCKYDVIMHI